MLFAGDAARIHSPIGGQGLNLGIQHHPGSERVDESPPDADDRHTLREIVIDLARLPQANTYLAGLMSGLDLRYDLGDPGVRSQWR